LARIPDPDLSVRRPFSDGDAMPTKMISNRPASSI